MAIHHCLQVMTAAEALQKVVQLRTAPVYVNAIEELLDIAVLLSADNTRRPGAALAV